MHKQQLFQQLNQLSKTTGQGESGMNTAAVQQQSQAVSHKLSTITQMISQVNQQLMILTQLSSQPKEVSRNSETGGPSPKMVHNVPLPVHFKADPKKSGSFGRSQSANAMVSLGIEPSRSLTYGVQGLSLNGPIQPGVSHSSARSMSRLQQIISGSCSTDDLMSRDESTLIPSVAPSSSFTVPGSLHPGNATSPFSSPQSGSTGLSNNNHFHLGGAPSTAASAPFTTAKSVNDIQEFRPGVPWQPKSPVIEPTQVYSKQASVPTGNSLQQCGPQQLSVGSNTQLVRSQSAVDYYNSAVSPQNKYTPISGNSSLRMGHKPYLHSQHQPKPSTPLPEMLNVGSGWKLKGRTIAPPSSLYPSQDFQYKPGFGTRKHHRISCNSQPQYGSSADRRSWGPSFASDTPSGSSPMISHTVWGPDLRSINNSEDCQRQGWGHGYAKGSHTWMNMRSNRCHHDAPSSFTSPQPQSCNTTPSDSYDRTSVNSLTSGSTWGQDELHSLSTKQGMVSPEPTFAEWQAGKKARLSVTKFPSNPPSPWLIIRNINPQVSFQYLYL